MPFNPMPVLAYTTLPPALRGYATALQALCRNMGQAIGVSVTPFMAVRHAQVSRTGIVSAITPFDRVLQGHDAVSRWLALLTRHGAAMLNRMVNHRARIIAYNNDDRLMTSVLVPGLLVLQPMRRHEPNPAPAPAVGD